MENWYCLLHAIRITNFSIVAVRFFIDLMIKELETFMFAECSIDWKINGVFYKDLAEAMSKDELFYKEIVDAVSKTLVFNEHLQVIDAAIAFFNLYP